MNKNMTTTLLTVPDILDIASDIFEEMVEDNLEIDDLNAFYTDFDTKGAMMAVEPAADWSKDMGKEVNLTDYIEVHVGFAEQDSDCLSDILARLLISRHPNDKDCYIKWKRK